MVRMRGGPNIISRPYSSFVPHCGAFSQKCFHVLPTRFFSQVLSEDFGLFIWPSGVVLAALIWARRREFRGVRVVEIGAGTALPGLLAAKVRYSGTSENIRAWAYSKLP